MKNPDLIKVKETLDSLEVGEHLRIASYLSVWSNGNKIRRYVGQDASQVPQDRYRRMVAILVEIDG